MLRLQILDGSRQPYIRHSSSSLNWMGYPICSCRIDSTSTQLQSSNFRRPLPSKLVHLRSRSLLNRQRAKHILCTWTCSQRRRSNLPLNSTARKRSYSPLSSLPIQRNLTVKKLSLYIYKNHKICVCSLVTTGRLKTKKKKSNNINKGRTI